jgi:nucleotide-binding universal stress UspA family protein
MTSILLAYDGSPSAAAAIRAAGSLFPGAETVALTVRRDPSTTPSAGAAEIALPGAAIADAMQALERAAGEEAATLAAEGAGAATAVGLAATAQVVSGIANPWREIQGAAATVGAELIACGSRGLGAPARFVLGSTSTGLLYHADRPLLIVPRFDAATGGPLVIGYDGSAPSREAIVVAGHLLAGRDAVVVCVWESLIRHSLSGRALASLPLEEVRGLTRDLDAYYGDVAADVAEEGAALARESGLSATAAQVEAAGSAWHGLLAYARGSAATAVVVGARGRGGFSSELLGSVSSGLAHHADLPVLVLRGAGFPQPMRG